VTRLGRGDGVHSETTSLVGRTGERRGVDAGGGLHAQGSRNLGRRADGARRTEGRRDRRRGERRALSGGRREAEAAGREGRGGARHGGREEDGRAHCRRLVLGSPLESGNPS
jgi:hypothetical protein